MSTYSPPAPLASWTPAAPVTAAAPPVRSGPRWLRGPDGDPAWVRPGLVGLLAATAVLYLWGLSSSGWANSFYAAATQAGSVSWKAFFYGSSDAASAITVDKPPASLWISALSVRAFGLNSWSILVPQAVEGVATVGVLYLAVRRWYGAGAGLLAGAILALTPVAVLMFRFNNPDALLALLLVGAAYAMIRAVEAASLRWVLIAATLVGFGFLTKMLQALLVVPALAAVYLIAAPTSSRRRLLHLLAAGGVLVASAGWWVAIVELVPAADRPYIGGSQTNSVLELIFGYNGFGRLTGAETGSVGGGNGWGVTGLVRLFNAQIGGQVAWLLPAAMIMAAAGVVAAGRTGRTDRQRAGLIVWGSWLLVTGLVFSLMQGIFHAYYTVALAPAIAACVAGGASMLWRRRTNPVWLLVLAATLAGTAVWCFALLRRSSDFLPGLAPAVLVLGLGTAGLLAVTAQRWHRLAGVLAGAGVLVVLAGPMAYSVETAGTAHAGAIPSAGPSVSGGAGFFGGPGQPGFPAFRGNGLSPGTAAPPGTAVSPGTGGNSSVRSPGGGLSPGGAGRAGGGLLDGNTPSAELSSLLVADADSYTWVAAAVGSNNASGYQLATGDPVMAIGGFNGSDPAPTLAQFQRYVANGQIHYFIGGSGVGGRSAGGSTASRSITTWVEANFTSSTVDGVTLFELSAGPS